MKTLLMSRLKIFDDDTTNFIFLKGEDFNEEYITDMIEKYKYNELWDDITGNPFYAISESSDKKFIVKYE